MNGNFEIPGTFLVLIFDFIFPVIFPCLEIVGNLYFFLVVYYVKVDSQHHLISPPTYSVFLQRPPASLLQKIKTLAGIRTRDLAHPF